MQNVSFKQYRDAVYEIPENKDVPESVIYNGWKEKFGSRIEAERERVAQSDGPIAYSVDQAQKTMGAGIRTIGQATGIEPVEDYGQSVIDQQEQDIEQGGYAPKYQGSFLDNYNQGGIGAALGWAAEKALENSVYTGGALAGSALAAATAPVSVPLSLFIGGSTLAASGLGITGETALEMEEKGVEVDTGKALSAGAVGMLLERFGLRRIFPKGVNGKAVEEAPAAEVIDELVKRGETGIAQEIAIEGSKRTLAEITAEVGQEGAIVGASSLAGAEYTGDELLNRVIDSAVVGGAISAPVAFGGAGVDSARERPLIDQKIKALRDKQALEDAGTESVQINQAAADIKRQAKQQTLQQGGDALDAEMAQSEVGRKLSPEIIAANQRVKDYERDLAADIEAIRAQSQSAQDQITKRTTPYRPDAGGLLSQARDIDLSLFPEQDSRASETEAAQEPVKTVAQETAAPTGQEAIDLSKTLPAPTGEKPVLQNRDRSTPASIEQMTSIAGNPDYGRLGFSRDFGNGAPVVEPGADIPGSNLGREDFATTNDGRRIPVRYAVVEADTLLPSNRTDGSAIPEYETGVEGVSRVVAGNGRVAGLQGAFVRGNADNYRQEMRVDSGQFGVDPAVIDGMNKPVLVRVMPREDITENIGDISNTSGTAELSPMEQARNDARRVEASQIPVDDDGQVSRQAAVAFINTMPESERSGLLDGKEPNRKAYERLENLIFSEAFESDALLRMQSEAKDPDVKNVMAGLRKSAGKMMQLKGAGDLDIRDLVTQAAETAMNAQRAGKPLSEYIQQSDLDQDPMIQPIVEIMANNRRSGKAIGEQLSKLADDFYNEYSRPESDMFGETAPKRSRAELLGVTDEQQTGTQDISQQGRAGTDAAINVGGMVSGRDTQDTGSTSGTSTTQENQPETEVTPPEAFKPTHELPNGDRVVAIEGEDNLYLDAEGIEVEDNNAIPLADELSLEAQTQADIDQQQVEQEKARQEAAEAERIAAQREQADLDRDDFSLTGSDSQRDVMAAQGQQDLLGTKNQEASPSITQADVDVAVSEANRLIADEINKKKGSEAQKAGKKVLEPLGVKLPIGKQRIIDAITGNADPLSAMDTLGINTSLSVRNALEANREGRVSSGDAPQGADAGGVPPNRGAIGGKLEAGEVVLTASGRETTPFPKTDVGSPRKTTNTLKRIDNWLMDNAIDEARARGDDFNLQSFEANRDKPSQADKDGAELYLFGDEQPPVPKPITRPLSAGQPDTNYVLPDTTAESTRIWTELSRSGELNDQQSLLADRVKNAKDSGLVSIREMLEYVNKQYPGFMPSADNAEFEIYSVNRYLESQQQKTDDSNAKSRLSQYQVGANLGTIVPNDAKQLRAATIKAINGNQYTIQGLRGARRAEVTMSASNLVRAIERGGSVLPEASKPDTNQEAQTPDDFVKAPDGSIDFGEITPEMARASGRQPGKVRLQKGTDSWGLKHIEARHGKEISKAGFESVEQFVADIAKNIEQIWRPERTRQLVALVSRSSNQIMFVELSPAKDASGDFYTVNTAYLSRQGGKKTWKQLWEGRARPSDEPGNRPPFAEPDQVTGGQATNPQGQSAVTDDTPATNQSANIEDFGEKILGARKDFASKMADAKEKDIAAVPLSQSWPEPDYQMLVDNGADPVAIGFARALREELPNKPRATWKLKGWAEKVEAARSIAEEVVAGNFDIERFRDEITPKRSFSRQADYIFGRAELYAEFGHEKSLKGIKFYKARYAVLQTGDKLEKDVDKWIIERPAGSSAFSNMPYQMVSADTKEAALERFRRLYNDLGATKKPRSVRFDIYTSRRDDAVFIGKKIGSDVVRIQEGFESVSDARKYLKENQQALEEKLARMKDVPNMRRESNSPRVGADHRNGGDVTPEQFSEAFGFRGVQFGNYVEQGRRQEDLNEAYDALMDMAGILNIPAKALSLNGELGLAFGARGKGGKRAAKAHYESGNVVINLTKKSGAGSLAHEWWHSLDNYFSRQGGKGGDFVTDKPWQKLDGVRPEMIEAFKNINAAINRTKLRQRSKKLDQTRTKPYWATDIEMTARAFESYVIEKLRDQEASNDYLANIVGEDYWNAAAKLGLEDGGTYPYPEAAEVPEIRAAYDAFFETVETKETDAGTMLYSFAGSGALTAGRLNLQKAIDMVAGGRDKNVVRRETGWMQGEDGKWRFEISDDVAAIKKPLSENDREWGDAFEELTIMANERGGVARVGDLLDHPALFAAYPDLADISLVSEEGNFSGIYYEIDQDGFESIGFNPGLEMNEVKSVLLHELQHAIQAREDFARGGNADADFTQSVKRAVAKIEDTEEARSAAWKAINEDVINNADSTAQAYRDALMYESMQRLMGYANRDKPSGVLRLIRNEFQWLFDENFRGNQAAQDLQREWYNLPKRHKMRERNQFLSDLSARTAQVLRDEIPASQLRDFKNDPRTVKGMIKALDREAGKARKALQPLRDIEKSARTAKELNEATQFKSPRDIYMALSGEIEARNVQTRMDMTPEQRLDKSPDQTRDVPRHEAIIIMGGMELSVPMTSQTTGKPESIAKLTGDEIKGDDPVVAGRRYYRENLQGQIVNREDIGDVRLSGKGWNKVKAGLRSDNKKLQLIPAIPNIIQNGQYGGRQEVSGRTDDIVAFHYFDGFVDLAGESVQVGVTVGEDSRGNLFYNLNHDTDKLWENRKGSKGIPGSARGKEPDDSKLSIAAEATQSGDSIQSITDDLNGVNITIIDSQTGQGVSTDRATETLRTDNRLRRAMDSGKLQVVQSASDLPDNASTYQSTLNEYPAYLDAQVVYDDVRDSFLDVLPEDADGSEVMESITDFTPEEQRLLRALDRDDWLGFDYPSQSIDAVLSGDIDRFDTSQGTKQAIGRLVNVKMGLQSNSTGSIQGAYANGTAYVVAQGNSAETLKSTAWHELTHAALDAQGDTFIRPEQKAKLFKRLDAQVKLARNSRNDSALKRAIARAERAGTTPENFNEEVAGYLVTDYVNDPQSLTGAIRQWVQDFIGAIQAAVLRYAGVQVGRVTGAELNAIAKSYADYVTMPDRGRMTEGGMALASMSDQVETKAFKEWFGYDWQNETERQSQGVIGRNASADTGTVSQAGQSRGSEGMGRDGRYGEEYQQKIREIWNGGLDPETGKPRVWYHGTSDEFTAFDLNNPNRKDHGWLGTGVYLTTSESLARSYANTKAGSADPRVMPLYSSVRNPYFATPADKQKLRYGTRNDADRITQSIKDDGYDGIAVMFADGTVELVAFDTNAVKSATGNNGNFDPDSDNILLSRAPADNPYDRAFESLGDKDKTVFNRAKRLLKRELLPGGLLPDTVFRAKIERDSEMNGMEFDIANRTGRLDKAIQEAYGKPYKDMDEADLLKINEALASADPDMSLPESVREQIYAMRGMIRGLSQKYADHLQSEIDQLEMDGNNQEAASKAALLQTILNNLDTYVHRSYRAFDDPLWPRKVPRETYDAAARYLERQYAGDGEVTPEIQDRVLKTIELMLEEGTAFDSMEAFIKESKLGAKDLSVLQRRKQIAPEIRELLGEYKDPKVNFTKSVTKMARLVFNQSFLDQVREIGLRDGFLFEKENRPLDATRRIAADASEAYAPLNGLYTYPDIDQAFKDALGKEEMADWFRAIVRANGMVKFGKTVLSPTTAARNWMSAMFFALANGHFDFRQIRNSTSSIREYFSQTGNKAEYLKKLKRLGVIYDTPYAGEMMDLLADSNIERSLFDKKPFTNIRAAVEFAQRLYQYGDDFWKVMGYENEKALLIKHKGLSEAEAEKEAAERIRNTYPTYSMTGRFVQRLRRFPLAGTFVSFPAEIIRTSYHIQRYARQDLKDTPALGRRKIAGLAIASGAIHGLQTLAMGLMGMGDDEEEAFRDLAAPWQRNSNIIPLGYDADGKIRLIDMSFLDPYNYWKRPINAMLRDQPFEDAAIDSAREMLSPFFGEDIAYGAISEVMNNKKASGGRVFNPNAPVLDQTADIADHLRKALQPGAFANAERIIKAASGEVSASGRPYTMKDEMAALVGFRITTFDPKSSIYYKAFEFQDKKRDATSIFNSIARNPNDISDGQLTRAYENAVETRMEAYEEMMRLIKAAMASGLTRSEAIRTLRNSGVSKTDSLALVQGRIPAWKPSNQSMANAVKRADVLFDPKITARLKERQELIRKQFMAGER